MKITDKHAEIVEKNLQYLETLDDKNTSQVIELEESVNGEIRQWHKKIKALGAQPKGLWMVHFNTRDGYFSWKYPETEIKVWKSFNDGYEIQIDGQVPSHFSGAPRNFYEEDSDCSV